MKKGPLIHEIFIFHQSSPVIPNGVRNLMKEGPLVHEMSRLRLPWRWACYVYEVSISKFSTKKDRKLLLTIF